jgi:hypothetical protein
LDIDFGFSAEVSRNAAWTEAAVEEDAGQITRETRGYTFTCQINN